MGSDDLPPDGSFGDEIEDIQRRLSRLNLSMTTPPLDLLFDIEALLTKLLNAIKTAKKRRHPNTTGDHPGERTELIRNYVIALIAYIRTLLFSMRWSAASDWANAARTVPFLQNDVGQVIADFKQRLRPVRRKLTYEHLDMIAVALRVSADELSLTANTSPGWIDSALECERQLRFLFNYYRTREMVLLFWRELPRRGVDAKKSRLKMWRIQTARRLKMGVTALFRLLYEVIGGYGLRWGRFIGSVFIVVLAFTGIYWAIDLATPTCFAQEYTIQQFLLHFVYSLGTFTTVANINLTSCTANTALIATTASAEAFIGYLMLGVLISIFWSAFQDSFSIVSNIRLPEKENSNT